MIDPETLKIPAFLRKKAIVNQARQKLILTALDRKEAGLSPTSKKALAPLRAKPNKFLPPPRRLKRVQAAIEPSARSMKSENSLTFSEKKIPIAGTITHYLDNIQVAIVKISVPLKVGDKIIMEGEGYLFVQTIEEMQVDRKPVTKSKKGSHIGLKVSHPATVKGSVYKLSR